ncbi:hypothetical protein [Arsenicicoccus bolidensis]|uniref:hypothetical protein n=3 Tax=Arsenicicoccus TaxID=267408 RepID=UPI000311CC15|nr:hypothetical protein [Arsenicicoccus bolidensis]
MLRRSLIATSATATATLALALGLGMSAPAVAAAPSVPTARATQQVTATAPAASGAVTARTRSTQVTRTTVHQIYVAIAGDRSMRGWKRADWRVQRISLAPGAPTWARATVHPTRGQTDDATVLLHKVAGRWRVADLGTAQVGCGVAPVKVLRGLRLGGC